VAFKFSICNQLSADLSSLLLTKSSCSAATIATPRRCLVNVIIAFTTTNGLHFIYSVIHASKNRDFALLSHYSILIIIIFYFLQQIARPGIEQRHKNDDHSEMVAEDKVQKKDVDIHPHIGREKRWGELI